MWEWWEEALPKISLPLAENPTASPKHQSTSTHPRASHPYSPQKTSSFESHYLLSNLLYTIISLLLLALAVDIKDIENSANSCSSYQTVKPACSSSRTSPVLTVSMGEICSCFHQNVQGGRPRLEHAPHCRRQPAWFANVDNTFAVRTNQLYHLFQVALRDGLLHEYWCREIDGFSFSFASQWHGAREVVACRIVSQHDWKWKRCFILFRSDLYGVNHFNATFIARSVQLTGAVVIDKRVERWHGDWHERDSHECPYSP